MLSWVFGPVESFDVENGELFSRGTLKLKNAEVKYNLSIDAADLPWKEWKAYRCIEVDGEELEFSEGFTELHNKSYEQILSGNGYGLKDIEPTIKLIESIRHA